MINSANLHFIGRFHKIRAIWAIIRDGSVVWNVDLKGTDGQLTTRAGKEAPGIVIFHGLTVNGRKLSLDDCTPAPVLAQADDTGIAADEDQEVR